MTAYLLGPPLIALLALALRLGWQARRHRTLTALAANLPPTTKVLDIRDDGSQLRILVVTDHE